VQHTYFNQRIKTQVIDHKVKYNCRLDQLWSSNLALNTIDKNKIINDYIMVLKFDILTVNGKYKLIKPVVNDTVLYYVTNYNLFDILHLTHFAIDLSRRNRRSTELKMKYCNVNVTNETMIVYLNFWVHCQKKSSTPKRGLISKPTWCLYITLLTL